MGSLRSLTSVEEGTNQFTLRALCSRIELDLCKVSQKTEYFCLFVLQDNPLLALKEFKKREEKTHQLQKCLIIKQRLQLSLCLAFLNKTQANQTLISPSNVCVCG